LPDRCGFAASICGGGLRRDDQRLCRPDVRRGCASPQPFKSNWGYAPRSAFGPKQGIARTEGEARSYGASTGEAEPRLTSGRRSRWEPILCAKLRQSL